jgi:ketosteroid isomerase-like protein
MSENLELVRSIVADWERGDFSRAGWSDAEIEHAMVGGAEGDLSWKGRSEMARAWGYWLRAFENVRVEAEDFRELDGERVLVLLTTFGRGKASGVQLAQTHVKGAVVFHVRNGKVTRLVQYWDRDRALTDLGLEE